GTSHRLAARGWSWRAAVALGGGGACFHAGVAWMLRSSRCCVAAAFGGRGRGAIRGLRLCPMLRRAWLAFDDSEGAELDAEAVAAGGRDGHRVGVAVAHEALVGILVEVIEPVG